MAAILALALLGLELLDHLAQRAPTPFRVWFTLALALGSMALLGRVGLAVWDAWFLRRRRWQIHKTKLAAMQAKVAYSQFRQLATDANSRGGWIMQMMPDGGHSVQSLDTHNERLLVASRGAAHPEAVVQPVGDDQAVALPDHLPIHSVLRHEPSYRNLVLGQGHEGIVAGDMARFVHGAIAGSSGWGKSMMLRWLCLQLCQSIDPLQLVLIDLEDVTLAPFESADNVLYPVASDERTILAIFRELADELVRRRELFRAFRSQGVDSLPKYNKLAPEPLAPLVVVIDEAAALMMNKDLQTAVKPLIWRARKYGFGNWWAAQVWYADTIPSGTSAMFGTAIHFHAEKESQARTLGLGGAAHIMTKGRALVRLPGQAPFEIQTPFVAESDLRRARGSGPLLAPLALADAAERQGDSDLARLLASPLRDKVLDQMERGTRKPTAICKALGLATGGKPWYDVRTLARHFHEAGVFVPAEPSTTSTKPTAWREKPVAQVVVEGSAA